MTRKNEIQTNFTSGELTPRLAAHVDLDRYRNGAKTINNFVILPHGPLQRRTGSALINEVKTSSTATRLLKFQFSQTFAYIIEFGNLYLRFYRNGGQIVSGMSAYELVSPYTTAELFQVTYVQLGPSIYLFHGSHPIYILTWSGDTSWTLKAVSFYPEPTIEDGFMPLGTVTPAATTGAGVNFTASGGNTFIAGDIGRQIVNLSGTGKAAITSVTSDTVAVCTILEAFPSTAAIPYQSWKKDLSPVVTLTPGGIKKGSMQTLTAGANAWYASEVAGKNFILNNGVAKLNSVTSVTAVVTEIQKTLDSTSAATVWSLEEPAWTATRGYPQVGAIHQSRLFAGCISSKVQTIWASETGIYSSMGIGAHDSDSLEFDLSSKEQSSISWMMPVRGDLAIGTQNAEITLSGSLTPSTIASSQQVRGGEGSNLQQPIDVNGDIIYVQKSGRKINSFRYDFDIDNYRSEDLLFLAQHMGASGIKEIAYANDPDRHIYAVLNNGQMLICTYVREQQVVAWARIITDGSYESVQSISTGEQDEVWVVVNRTINGSTKRYIERFDNADGQGNLDGFSDSYLTFSNSKTISNITQDTAAIVSVTSNGYSNGDLVKFFDVGGMTEVIGKTYVVSDVAANAFRIKDTQGNYIDTTGFSAFTSGGTSHKLVTTISGLSHLEGKLVQVKADGAKHADKTVSSGAITLDRPSYDVVVGLSYTSLLITLKKEYNLGEGTQQGQKARWVRPVLRLDTSALPLLNGEFVPARSPQDLMDNKLGLYTGDVFYGPQDWHDGAVLEIETDLPLPCTILGVFGSIEGGSQ